MWKKPPDWKKYLTDSKNIVKFATASEPRDLIKKANREYLHWDKFRYQKMPVGISPETAWAFLKLNRTSMLEQIPVNDEKGNAFSFSVTREHTKDLSYIDSNTSGVIAGNNIPNDSDRDRLIINGLIEEAISSSQIEGATTTRKVAKAMIELKREPSSKHERMILNNYLAMDHLEEWKDRELSDKFILELHKVLTQGTLDDADDEGKFRSDEDEIVVLDSVTGEVMHTPPKIGEAKKQLKELYDFINKDDDENFIHPFVKASILHFCIGYIHPFVDGNGRLARSLFYWFLIKKGYWMFKYIPISLQIKKKEWKTGYYKAFRYVETDEGDITYFISYKLKVARNAIEEFYKYVKKQQDEASRLKDRLTLSSEINARQLDVVDLMQKNSGLQLDLKTHQQRYKIAYETARTDILELVDQKVLKQITKGRKYIFIRGERFPSK